MSIAALSAAQRSVGSPRPQKVQLWFGAEPPIPLGSREPTGGSSDYADWLTGINGWESSSKLIHAIKVNASWIEKIASEETLRAVFLNLSNRNIKVALEISGLRATQECRGDGFYIRDPAVIFRKIISAGGKIDYLVFNEPFAWATMDRSQSTCRRTPDDVAAELRTFGEDARKLFPLVEIGDVEPLWANVSSTDLVSWVDAYRRVTGRGLEFFHMDFDFRNRRTDWLVEAEQISLQLGRRNVPFGVHVFGDRSDPTGEQWVRTALGRAAEVYKANVNVAALIVQSWHPLPRRVLPEQAQDTLMSLLLRIAAIYGITPATVRMQVD